MKIFVFFYYEKTCKNYQIDPKKINVVYYDGTNIVKTSYIELTKSNVEPPSASKRLLR